MFTIKTNYNNWNSLPQLECELPFSVEEFAAHKKKCEYREIYKDSQGTLMFSTNVVGFGDFYYIDSEGQWWSSSSSSVNSLVDEDEHVMEVSAGQFGIWKTTVSYVREQLLLSAPHIEIVKLTKKVIFINEMQDRTIYVPVIQGGVTNPVCKSSQQFHKQVKHQKFTIHHG